MAMVIDNIYQIGESVYLKTDIEQLQRVVCQINVTKLEITYVLACGERTSNHYDYEIIKERIFVEGKEE